MNANNCNVIPDTPIRPTIASYIYIGRYNLTLTSKPSKVLQQRQSIVYATNNQLPLLYFFLGALLRLEELFLLLLLAGGDGDRE